MWNIKNSLNEFLKGWTLFLQFGAESIPIWFKCFWTYIRFYWSKMVQIKIKLDSNVQNYQFWASEHPPLLEWTHNQHLLKKMKKNAKNHQNWAVSTMTGKEIGNFFFFINLFSKTRRTCQIPLMMSYIPWFHL